MDVILVLILFGAVIWFLKSRIEKHEIDMELAKHGLTRESAKAGVTPRRQAKSSKSSAKSTMKPASTVQALLS